MIITFADPTGVTVPATTVDGRLVVAPVLAFTSHPVRALRGFAFGAIVAVQNSGVRLASDSETVVTLRIKPGTGDSGAALTCTS